jgi:osmoprotectant transport system ATP-binding protein
VHKTIVFVTHDIDEAIKMGDRMAILNVGGILEQLDTPAEILRSPANAFVEGFIGAERGLKRLALIKVSETELEEGPVVAPGDPVEKALAEMDRFSTDWVSVIEDGELLGWVGRDGLEGKRTVGEVPPRRFSAYVTTRDSLRQALDSIVTSRTNVAVVVSHGQRYLGVLTLGRISAEIVSR